MLEKLEQKKKKLLTELEKVIKQIAFEEDIQHQLQSGARMGKQKTRSSFEKTVRSRFRISNNQN